MKFFILFCTLICSINSFAAFTCAGKTLIGSGYGSIYTYPSNEDCLRAVKLSQNEFTCAGKTLLGSGYGSIYSFNSFEDCWSAVNNSKR
ncbi:MAG: hypothetical protein QE271_13385 [Bacteriovoracaceae bacterium]|nr:hypothetical protein [Bacteriovoracaceae bacterium]